MVVSIHPFILREVEKKKKKNRREIREGAAELRRRKRTRRTDYSRKRKGQKS